MLIQENMHTGDKMFCCSLFAEFLKGAASGGNMFALGKKLLRPF